MNSMNPRISHRTRHLSTAALAVAVLVVAAMVLFSQSASAALGPLVVRGYIRDNAGNPLENSAVTVNIRYPDTTLRSTLSDTSDSNGFYSVTFGPPDWDIGNTIEVIATYNSNQEDNSTVATSAALQYVNVTFPFEIDEFGAGWLGFVMAGGAIAAVAAVFLVARRKR